MKLRRIQHLRHSAAALEALCQATRWSLRLLRSYCVICDLMPEGEAVVVLRKVRLASESPCLHMHMHMR